MVLEEMPRAKATYQHRHCCFGFLPISVRCAAMHAHRIAPNHNNFELSSIRERGVTWG